jgi:hypothetical protein
MGNGMNRLRICKRNDSPGQEHQADEGSENRQDFSAEKRLKTLTD